MTDAILKDTQLQPQQSVDASETEPLPALSSSEFKRYNRLARQMDVFHSHFRHSWTTMQTVCTTSKRPSGMTLRQFIAYSLDFCYSLNMHHNIEEKHVFPNLARKMPVFRNNELMKAQHREIHSGLDMLQKWLEECKNGEREYRAGEMKEIMESFGDVLWKHLDEEVVQLGAENMRKFWTKEEIDHMIF